MRIVAEELFWKLRGERNIKSLVDKNVHIWDANAFDHYIKKEKLTEGYPKHTQAWNEKFAEYQQKIKEDAEFAAWAGDLGPVYGCQVRHWKYGDDLSRLAKKIKDTAKIDIFERIPELEKMKHLFASGEVDQLDTLLKKIQKEPGSRYHILNSWNPGERKDMAIGPCAFWDQFTVYNSKIVDLTNVQRSNDVFLGVPFNEAQEGLLALLIANETGFIPRRFDHLHINTHVYLGVPPRSDFWQEPKNVQEFQRRFNKINPKRKGKYLKLKEWYLNNSAPERSGSERKDHVPFLLEQLSKEPRPLPTLRLKNPDLPLYEAIQMDAWDVIEKLENYNPHKWDNRASMAA